MLPSDFDRFVYWNKDIIPFEKTKKEIIRYLVFDDICFILMKEKSKSKNNCFIKFIHINVTQKLFSYLFLKNPFEKALKC